MSDEKEVQEVKAEEKKETKPEFTKEELLEVFDKILFEGEYSEEVKIRGKLPVTFKSRTGEQVLEISKKIDKLEANLITTLNEQRAILNLGYSLIDYSGKDLSKSSVEQRLDFVKKLPISVIAALSDALAKFDRKVDLACREGEENF